MIVDAVLDVLSAPANWILDLLPASTWSAAGAVGSAYADPSSTLGWINGQQNLVTGGPGFIFNGGLIVAMLTMFAAIEGGIFTVRTLVWIKKALLF